MSSVRFCFWPGDDADRRDLEQPATAVCISAWRCRARRSASGLSAHAHRVFLAAEHLTWATPVICEICWPMMVSAYSCTVRERQRVRYQRQEQHRRVRRVHLAEARRHGHLRRQLPLRHRKGGLHVERRGVDVAGEIELHRDRGRSGGAARRVIEVMPAMVASWRSIGVATDAAMVSGLAPGSVALNLDGREIDARQRRHRRAAGSRTRRP